MDEAKLRVWQLPRAWGIPNPSPFCMKLEAWLRMANIPHEMRTLAGPPRSPTGKAPYVEHPDGRLLTDTSLIIQTLTRERKVALDSSLDAAERAKLVALQRVFEEHLYWIIVIDRWLPDEQWAKTKRAYFGGMPAPLRWLVPAWLRRSVRRDVHGQGLGRLERAQLLSRAQQDLEALSAMLGDQHYFLGRRTSIDAIALAFLSNIYLVPIDGVLAEAARPLANLRRYTHQLFSEVFPEYPLPAAAGG